MSAKYCVDANIFIESWNVSYSIEIFPSLWEQISQHRQDLILIKPVYDEIDPISAADRNLSESDKKAKYPLRMWLTEHNFLETPITRDVENLSLTLERKYKIREQSGGAGQVDIMLIAYAKINAKTVVTYENPQPNPPGEIYKYKIPLICEKEDIRCIKFPELLKGLGIRI